MDLGYFLKDTIVWKVTKRVNVIQIKMRNAQRLMYLKKGKEEMIAIVVL
jgi:hypothetical protein